MGSLLKTVKSKIELLAVRDRREQEANRRGLMSLHHQIAECEKIPLAFGHLLALDQQKAHVQPVADELLSGQGFRLRDLILMMGEDQIFPTRMQVKALS